MDEFIKSRLTKLLARGNELNQPIKGLIEQIQEAAEKDNLFGNWQPPKTHESNMKQRNWAYGGAYKL